MIPNAQDRNVQSSGVTASGTFGISTEDTAHIMGILRDTLYTDRVLAVLREYASNAWDANREAGKGDTPIKIHVPTSGEPTLTIRDFGSGLADSDVFDIYTQYGKSTKRDSDLAVGMLGIGSKSAFAYSDTFTVTSWHGGMKRIYVAVLDDSDLGVMQRLYEEPCSGDETGVEIKVAVRPEDIWEFQRKAMDLFSHFVPRPEINIGLRPECEIAATLKSGAIHEDGEGWLALMGCVPYRINIEQIRGSDEAEGVWLPLSSMSGVLYFDIGEVEISASREELKYTKQTKAVLLGRFGALLEEYVTHSLKLLKDESVKSWTKRLRLHGLGKLGLPFPESAKSWVSESVPLYKEHVRYPFIVLRGSTSVGKVTVSSNTRFVIQDINRNRSYKGYDLGYYNYVVKPNPGVPIDKVRVALAEVIKEAGLEGVECVDISTLPYQAISKGRRFAPNKKHQVKSFKLSVDHYHAEPKSKRWEIASHIPSDDDVYVIISRFEADGYSQFIDDFGRDKYLAKELGITMPDVYGYKTSEKDPLTEKDCRGTPYRKWREEFFRSKMTPELWALMSEYEWSELLCSSWSESYRNPFKAGTVKDRAVLVREHLEELLGEGHLIVDLFTRHAHGCQAVGKSKYSNILKDLFGRYGHEQVHFARLEYQVIKERYPLLDRIAGVSALWEADDRYSSPEFKSAKEWADYIKMVDKIRALEEKTETRGLTLVTGGVV